MRWGITFLAWVLTGLYLSTTCLDYVRVWQDPPPGYTQERVLPHLKACGKRKSLEFGAATIVLVALYYGAGLATTRLGASRRKNGREADGSPRDGD
jgi:hypothetical protein